MRLLEAMAVEKWPTAQKKNYEQRALESMSSAVARTSVARRFSIATHRALLWVHFPRGRRHGLLQRGCRAMRWLVQASQDASTSPRTGHCPGSKIGPGSADYRTQSALS